MSCKYCRGKTPLIEREKGNVKQVVKIYKGVIFSYITVDYTNNDSYELINYCPICGTKLNRGNSRIKNNIINLIDLVRGERNANNFNIEIDLQNELKIITCRDCKEVMKVSLYKDTDKVKRKHKCR